ncbi:MAG TPA: putative toxin-antitoxin system toxin component, PIN family [Methylomirabilota bacterium]|nr:putative toxin-antitoxin system toxin component, PIN family [Methylomirabilota bacterium]
MIRVVADTNVYVSAVVFGGACEAILALARARVVELFISPAIQKELRSVLSGSFKWTELQVRDAMAEINSLTSTVRPSETLSGVTPHDQDHRILECAVAARVDFSVTGDKKDLQPLKRFRGVQIVSPREFLDRLP